jgi:TonB family protein
MSAAATQAPLRGVTDNRRVPRYPLAVPAEVTVLRSGIPYSVPGRLVSIGGHGLGVVLAGELHCGDSVGLAFYLPDTNGQLRLKAVVRYQALLHCGLEFLNLTSEQQTQIERWTRKASAANPRTMSQVASAQPAAPPPVTMRVPIIKAPARKNHSAIFRPALWVVIAAMLLMGGLGWWRWYRAWGELESHIPGSMPLSQQPPATVPADVMEGLVTHKVEPIYPEAARQANIQGVVVLEALIGRDGTVLDVHPISGPDELTLAAVDAVKWWRFQPYLVNGQAVQVKTTLAVDFRGN